MPTSVYARLQSTVLAIAALISVAFALGAQAQISDTTPPHLVNETFSPTSIDVTSGAQTVTVTVTATDDLSGMTFAQAFFTSPSRAQSNGASLVRNSGTPLSGVYLGTVSFPRFSESGTWNLTSLTLFDAAGNRVTYTAANLQALGFPVNLDVTSTPDVAAPRLTGVALSSGLIDVSTGPQNLTLTLDATDDLSGVDFTPAHFVEFRVQMISPSGGQFQFVSRPQFAQIAGTTLNGRWQAIVPFPRFSEAGTWSIQFIRLVDFAGNQVLYSTATIRALGLPTDFTVVSVPSDSTRPVVTGLSFTPAVFDTSTAPQQVTVNLRVTDNLAGTSFGPDNPSGISFVHGVRFISPSGGQVRGVFNQQFTLTAGTPLDGVWTGQAFFPQFSEAGTWKVSLDNIKDAINNGVLNGNYTTEQLAALGFPSTVTIFRPSGVADGSVGSAGGVVMDTTFTNRAAVSFPPGSVQASTTVAIDVLSSSTDLGLPIPAGFSAGTLFVNIALVPTPPMPFAAPGLTLVLPFSSPKTPGASIQLFRLDPVLGQLIPAINVSGGNAMGLVNADGLSATFMGVSHLSTVVGFFPTAVLGDTNGDGEVDCDDLAIVRASFGKRPGQAGFDVRADVNRNGVVDVSDLALVSRQLPGGTKCR